MINVEQLEAELREARGVLNAAEAAEHQEVMAVKMAHAHTVGEARRAVGKLEWAIKEANSAAASHPWEGRKVVMSKPVYASKWSSQQTGTAKIYGVVEVCRVDTVFSANMNWKKPVIGQPFVRLLKKDGTVGTNIDADTRYGNLGQWKLDDEETAVA